MAYELKLYRGWETVCRDKKDRVPDRFLSQNKVNRLKKFLESGEAVIVDQPEEKPAGNYMVQGANGVYKEVVVSREG